MIKTPKKFIALLSGAALLTSSAFAQTVATNPVGYVSTTTPTGDDALIGLPFTQTTAFAGAADSVDGTQVTVTATLVVDAYNNTHYALATSGANAGQWSEVVGTSASSITTAEEILAATDTFEVVPFWTLATAFPGGEGVGVNTDPNAPTATVLINDPTAVGINLSAGSSYLYFEDGVNDGWYDANTFASANDLALVPDSYLIIRNNTASPIVTVTSGAVPVNVVGSTISRQVAGQQDSQLVNPYPAGLTLDGSNLAAAIAATTNPSSPTDTVLIYDIDGTSGQNISAAATYLYYEDGGVNDGWYDANTFAAAGSVEIPAGGAFIVRRAAGSAELAEWNPTTPYSL
jgi:uncharacterized protein (TIGR02597 family)